VLMTMMPLLGLMRSLRTSIFQRGIFLFASLLHGGTKGGGADETR
jgi:hypothetical protein